MSNKRTLEELKEEIHDIQQKISQLGPMHPGSISMQYQICGNPTCKCMRKDNPQRHGPYAKLSFTRRGRRICRFVRADSVEKIKPQLQAHKEFKKLTDRWVALSIKIGEAEFFSGKESIGSRRATY